MGEWDQAYHVYGFEIQTDQPSKVVQTLAYLLLPQSRVLDLGCGQGRNAIYLAQLGHLVDSYDLVITDFSLSFPNIRFTQGSILDQEYCSSSYQAAVMTRLIQYLSPEELENLLAKVSSSLQDSGLIGLSYTASGGIHTIDDYHLKTFQHPLGFVIATIEASGLEILSVTPGSGISEHLPYTALAETYDILVKKP